jgi:ABC-type branched-subunit amino acid transport system ATPase component
MKVLQVKNLTKQFDGVRAVDNLSLSMERGTIVSVVGPNGSGKTTLINLLSGIMPIDGGAVAVRGQVLYQVQDYQAASYGLTRTFQEVRLFNQMTVLDNLLVVLTKRPVLAALFSGVAAAHLQRAEAILKQIGLWDKRTEQAGSLSYGQRKLLEIGRALAMDTEIFLFDEPFAGLFPEMAKTIVEVMQRLKADGKTIMLIEHNMDLIRQLSDQVIVMDSGQLLAQGPPAEVLARKEVIEAYLGE